jgi:hypothetical protein
VDSKIDVLCVSALYSVFHVEVFKINIRELKSTLIKVEGWCCITFSCATKLKLNFHHGSRRIQKSVQNKLAELQRNSAAQRVRHACEGDSGGTLLRMQRVRVSEAENKLFPHGAYIRNKT